MYEFNNKLYVLRNEYFGGLLINKETMHKYQIPDADLFFLELIKKGFH